MDFSASSLIAGLLVSSLGTGIFLYGKATSKFLPLIIGAAMFFYPLFIYNPWLLWSITAVLCVVLYAGRERA